MNPYKKVAFHTLGCKLNYSETSTIARQFVEAGYARVSMEEQPDVLVINTCSVTDQADQKCRNMVRRAIRKNPDIFVAVIGCYAQLKPAEIAQMEGVSLVLGANEKFNILKYVEGQDIHERGKVVAGEIKQVKHFVPSFSHGERTRTFLKIQDGCNYFCAFCTIPLARGRSRSATIESTLIEAQKAIQAGAKEIVLTGVNIGDFGTAHGEKLIDLLRALDALQGIERYRISSIEPNLLTDEIIAFVATSRHFMPHFHIPLQSGSDIILEGMRRRYRTALYADRVQAIQSLMPHACIGADVIVGFPGESEKHFQETYRFLADHSFSYLHVFTYSERENTTALRIADVVPIEIRHQRNKMLRILSEKKKRAFYNEHLGKPCRVLWEETEDDGRMGGFTDNYIRVNASYQPEYINSLTDFLPEQIDHFGEMCGLHLEKQKVASFILN